MHFKSRFPQPRSGESYILVYKMETKRFYYLLKTLNLKNVSKQPNVDDTAKPKNKQTLI